MLDRLDKKIINSLNSFARASYSSIARKVRSSKEVVSYRVKRLIEDGVILEFVTIFGFGYWAYKTLVQFEKISSAEEKEIIGFLTNHDYVNWVTPCSGNWDLVFSIMAKDPAHFDKILREILGNIGEYLQDYKVSVSIGSETFGHRYVLGTTSMGTFAKRNTCPIDFDEKDKKIASLLLKNARIKLIDIHARTGIPVDTIKYRMKKMEKNKIIKRYRLILDPGKLGYNRYELFIRCVNLTDEIISRFRGFAKDNPNVEYFGRCVGSWDIEYTVHLKNSLELRDFILKIKQRFGGLIKNFESIILFDTKNFVYMPEELKP